MFCILFLAFLGKQFYILCVLCWYPGNACDPSPPPPPPSYKNRIPLKRYFISESWSNKLLMCGFSMMFRIRAQNFADSIPDLDPPRLKNLRAIKEMFSSKALKIWTEKCQQNTSLHWLMLTDDNITCIQTNGLIRILQCNLISWRIRVCNSGFLGNKRRCWPFSASE